MDLSPFKLRNSQISEIIHFLNLQTLTGCIFHMLYHFVIELHNLTKFMNIQMFV